VFRNTLSPAKSACLGLSVTSKNVNELSRPMDLTAEMG